MSCSPTHTVPVRDGSPFLGVLQAINCLATIIQSLRDKVRFVPSGQSPIRPFGTTNFPDNCPQKRRHPAEPTRGRRRRRGRDSRASNARKL